jgi:hypothetical protein
VSLQKHVYCCHNNACWEPHCCCNVCFNVGGSHTINTISVPFQTTHPVYYKLLEFTTFIILSKAFNLQSSLMHNIISFLLLVSSIKIFSNLFSNIHKPIPPLRLKDYIYHPGEGAGNIHCFINLQRVTNPIQ